MFTAVEKMQKTMERGDHLHSQLSKIVEVLLVLLCKLIHP
jgi:hypothetical protein